MFRMNKDELEKLVAEAVATRWHDKDHGAWFAGILATLVTFAARARQSGVRSHQPAEDIVWGVFQAISHPDDARQHAQEHRNSFATHTLPLPDYLVTGPTPEQEAEDAQRLNDFARRLLVIFGVQKPVGEALVRMQAREKTFYDPEHWAERGAWILSEFCAVDPTAS